MRRRESCNGGGTLDRGCYPYYPYYQVLFHLAADCRLRVGSLGEIDFKSGYYVYTGKANRNLSKRVKRHQGPSKIKRWHVDHLAEAASFVEAYVYPSSFSECALAEKVRSSLAGELAFPRFGASDCLCPGHLAYFRCRPALPLPGGSVCAVKG